MIAYVAVSILVAIWFFLLRPRTGGKNAPPTVTWSTVVPVPIFGVIIEFFKSPNTMVKRCLKDIGPVFTVPVRTTPNCFLAFFLTMFFHSYFIND